MSANGTNTGNRARPDIVDGGTGVVDVLAAALAPGVPTMRRRAVHGAVLFVLGVVAPIAWLVVAVLRH